MVRAFPPCHCAHYVCVRLSLHRNIWASIPFDVRACCLYYSLLSSLSDHLPHPSLAILASMRERGSKLPRYSGKKGLFFSYHCLQGDRPIDHLSIGQHAAAAVQQCVAAASPLHRFPWQAMTQNLCKAAAAREPLRARTLTRTQ